MNVDFQRRVDRQAGTAICHVLSWLPHARRQPPAGLKPRKILVILLSEMGSLVLACPMFERLKRTYPDASLFALVFEQNREVLSLLNVVPDGNIITVRNTSLRCLVADSLRALKTLRATGIDAVIDCELFSRVSSIFSCLSGARLRAGFERHNMEGLYRGDFINRPVLYNPYLHIAHQFVNLVEAIESRGRPGVKRAIEGTPTVPRITFSDADRAAMARRLEADFPRLAGRRLVLVYPGGGLLPIRAWPLPYFRQLVQALIERGHAVGIIGMRRDKEIAQDILAHCHSPDCFDLTGYTRTVRELLVLFDFASLLITNDGGPCHFASLTPLPSITFYGPETPALYAPLSTNAEIFYTAIACSPCLTAYNHRKSPCDGNNVCLKAISPEIVLRKALQMLGSNATA